MNLASPYQAYHLNQPIGTPDSRDLLPPLKQMVNFAFYWYDIFLKQQMDLYPLPG